MIWILILILGSWLGKGNAGEDEDGTSCSERNLSSCAGAGGVGGMRRKGRRKIEQLRSYRNSYQPRGVVDGSPPRIPHRSISPSPTPIPSQKEKEKDKDNADERDKSNLKPRKSKNNGNKNELRQKAPLPISAARGAAQGPV